MRATVKGQITITTDNGTTTTLVIDKRLVDWFDRRTFPTQWARAIRRAAKS